MKTHLDVEALKYEATAATEPKVAFDDVKVKNGTAQALDKDVGQLGLLNTWLGYVLLDGYTADYLNWRHQLSEAGYWGRWDDLWSILDVGKQVYHETWANAIRLSEAVILELLLKLLTRTTYQNRLKKQIECRSGLHCTRRSITEPLLRLYKSLLMLGHFASVLNLGLRALLTI